MKRLSVVFGICVGAIVGVAAQSAPPSPVFIVRLDDSAASAQQPAAMVPGNPPAGAAANRQLQPLPMTRLDDSIAPAILDAPRTVSLRFSAPQPVRQVLMLLVRDTGLSLVASPDVDGTFTGELAGVTLRRALDLVLETQGLEYRIDKNAIHVFRRETVTRILDVNAIAARRAGDAAGDTFDDLARSLAGFLSAAGHLGVDRKAGLVHVTDYPERIERAAAYIESLERRLNRQVDIQARVVEVSLADVNAAGVNWNQAIVDARAATAGQSQTIDADRLIRALTQQGTVSVLTTSRVQALHNEQAVIRVGTDGPAFEGLALSVTPHVSVDGTILMTLDPRLSQALKDSRAGASSAPALAIAEFSTAVRVRDGETLILPGIRRAHSEVAILLTAKVI